MSSPDNIELRRASRRLAAQFALLIILLFALLGGVVFAVVSASQSESAQRTLIDASMVDSPHDAPPGVFVVIVGEDGTQASEHMPDGLPEMSALQDVATTGRAVQQTRILDGRTYAIRTSADHGRITQVALDRHESFEELQRLGVALAISAIVAAVAAGLIAAWMGRRAMKPLATALALQRRFVTDASHELRTPLTLLSTRAQLVRRNLPRDAGAVSAGDIGDGLDEIVQDSRVLTEILEDLLIAADPREVAERHSQDLTALAEEATGSMQPDASARGIVLRRTGAAGPVVATVARVSIQRLFTALIANALDHAAAEIDVEVTLRGREAIIRVIDDGPGFPHGMDERAFERFASVRQPGDEPGRPRHYGLGLALVAEVAVRHGGGVSVEARSSDGGAVVIVRIPTHA
ncbi:MAG: HAMP domain-containing sensor histidine kinase [Microbacteriaceae bacterium]